MDLIKQIQNGSQIEEHSFQEKKEAPGTHMRVMEKTIEWFSYTI